MQKKRAIGHPVSHRVSRRKRRRHVWAVMRGVAAFAVALPVLLWSAYLSGDLQADPGAAMRRIRPAELAHSRPAVLETIQVQRATPAAARRASTNTPALPTVDDGLDILNASELEAISQAR